MALREASIRSGRDARLMPDGELVCLPVMPLQGLPEIAESSLPAGNAFRFSGRMWEFLSFMMILPYVPGAPVWVVRHNVM